MNIVEVIKQDGGGPGVLAAFLWEQKETEATVDAWKCLKVKKSSSRKTNHKQPRGLAQIK